MTMFSIHKYYAYSQLNGTLSNHILSLNHFEAIMPCDRALHYLTSCQHTSISNLLQRPWIHTRRRASILLTTLARPSIHGYPIYFTFTPKRGTPITSIYLLLVACIWRFIGVVPAGNFLGAGVYVRLDSWECSIEKVAQLVSELGI